MSISSALSISTHSSSTWIVEKYKWNFCFSMLVASCKMSCDFDKSVKILQLLISKSAINPFSARNPASLSCLNVSAIIGFTLASSSIILSSCSFRKSSFSAFSPPASLMTSSNAR